jgi:hypothetical protein
MLFASNRREIAIRFALIVVAWSAHTWWAGQQAAASCGDYVMLGGVHDAFAGTAGGRVSSSPDKGGGVPACSGPQCQRRVPLPTAPRQAFPSGPHKSAYCRAEAIAAARKRSMLIVEPALLISQAVVPPPDRPPRTF